MASNNLTLRTLTSPYSGDISRGRTLSWDDVDGNFIHLKGLEILTAETRDISLILTTYDGTEITTDLSTIIPDCSLTEDVTSSLNSDVGAITPAQMIPSGTTFTEFVQLLLSKTYTPTYTAPSLSLGASPSGSFEVGSLINLTLTATGNQGSINGKNVGGVWNPSAYQAARAGSFYQYTISGQTSGSNTLTVNNYSVVAGTNSFAATGYYNIGSIPYDSAGTSIPEDQLPAGTVNQTTSISGYRKMFFGATTDTSVYTTSSQIRALTGGTLNPTVGMVFNLNIPAGSTMITIALPQVNGITDVTVKLGAQPIEPFDLVGNGFRTVVSVEGDNSYASIQYNLLTYIPNISYPSDAVWNITLK